MLSVPPLNKLGQRQAIEPTSVYAQVETIVTFGQEQLSYGRVEDWQEVHGVACGGVCTHRA